MIGSVYNGMQCIWWFHKLRGNEAQYDQQPRLINKLTVPTIHPACIYNEKPLCLLTSSQVVKTQKQSVFQ